MKHWTASYDYGTWQVRDPDISSWGMNRKSLVGRIEPGDIIVCYVVKIGWTGLLRAKSTARIDAASSPHGDAYPVVIDAEDLLVVEPERAYPPARLPKPDPILRQGDDGEGRPIPMLFQGSGIQLSGEMGNRLADLIRDWVESDPKVRSLSDAQRSYSSSTPKGTTSQGDTVSIPSDDVDEDALDDDSLDEEGSESVTVTAHSDTQRKLLELGHRLGFTPWVTPDDQSRAARSDGTALAQLPGVTTDLPEQFNQITNDTIRHIDAMWLQGAGIRAAFEVENSTSIYSGVLRMADLLALQPNIDIPLFIVVPDERLDKATDQLLRPVFQTMSKPLSSMCRVLTYSAVDELLDLATKAGGALNVAVFDTFAIDARDSS